MNDLTNKNYDLVPDYLTENLHLAMEWAIQKLNSHGGEGWNINVVGNDMGKVCCCFDKSEWKADFCGEYMDTASEAVVIAVCEFLGDEIKFKLEDIPK